MKNHKTSKKDKKEAHRSDKEKSDLSCCYVADPCGCYYDSSQSVLMSSSCGCYYDACGNAYVRSTCCC